MNWISIIENTVKAFVGINAVYFALAAIGLNVQFGYAGLLNFGQAAFMACGAYGLGMTSQYFQINMWWGVLIGLGFSLVLALLLGVPTLRLRADYLAIVTIAAAEIIRLVVRSVRFNEYFNGSDGINEFSGPFREIGNDLIAPAARNYGPSWTVPGIDWTIDVEFTGRQVWTLIIGWALVLVCGAFVFLVMRSPWGRVLKGIREDENAVASLGKNVFGYKMSSLIIGGMIGTFAGMMLALDRGSVQPDNYSRDVTFFILTALVLGGLASVTGSIVGPMVFWAVFQFTDVVLREAIGGQAISIGNIRVMDTTQIGPTNQIMIGMLLILLMVYRPQGLFGNRKEMAIDAR
ncbi:MAG: branched-chain amino acid ABC transporter permease [Acidimicrobiia bacterium]|jgi:branched-chain amino acid transport system permease protein|nr:branched-chain amino acid ABC transporter permease [Acidimicrobiia bacterium]